METPQLSSLYQQLILEHYRNPRNKGELEEKTVEIHMANPVCESMLSALSVSAFVQFPAKFAWMYTSSPFYLSTLYLMPFSGLLTRYLPILMIVSSCDLIGLIEKQAN